MTIDSPALTRLGWDVTRHDDFLATAPPHTVPARVTRVAARIVSVAAAAGGWEVVIGGRLLGDPPEGGLTTGDWVAVDDHTAYALLPRRTVLVRHAAGRATVAQAVAANVDLVFIAVPLGLGVNLRRLERTLAIAYSSRATPVVLLTKSDLTDDVDRDLGLARSVSAGAAVIAVNQAGEGVAEVGRQLAGATGVIVGPSGAGKSTLINSLVGSAELATAAVRDDGRGRHTTTHRELIELPGGGLLIDTPGMRSMGVWDSGEGIESVFADLLELAAACRFRDCRHDGEPGCAVAAAAIDDPRLLERLASLRKLEREQVQQERLSVARTRSDGRRRMTTRAPGPRDSDDDMPKHEREHDLAD